MSFRIRAGKKSAREISRVADERLAKAVEALRTGTPKGVHDARKRLKETRALLRLVRQPLGKTRFAEWNGRLRDLAQDLSAQRDAAAMVEAWDRLVERDRRRFSSAAMKRVRARLLARVEQAPETLQGQSDTADALDQVRMQLGHLPLEAAGFKLFAAGVGKTYGDGRKALKSVQRAPRHDELRHEWRKRVKDHWYQVRLLRDAWPKIFGAREAALKTLADHLGEDHDLFVLANLLQSEPALFGAANTQQAIQAAIAVRQGELYTAAMIVGRRVYADKPDILVKRWARYWRVAQEDAQRGRLD